MQTSIFIAKLIGPVALLMGLVVLLNPTRVRTMTREMLQGEAFIFLSGIITLPIGLVLVNTHNLWTSDWRVLITLFGWGAVVAGIARIAFGGQLKTVGAAMIDSKVGLAIPGAFMTLLGAFLSFHAYLS
ncbi:MAG: hypothetical protein ACI89J_000964 [Hyphomicrobiaceae bacterium]|jgi:hypothetical protein